MLCFFSLSGVQALSPTQASMGLNVINGGNPQRVPAAGEWHLHASVALLYDRLQRALQGLVRSWEGSGTERDAVMQHAVRAARGHIHTTPIDVSMSIHPEDGATIKQH